MTEVILIIIAFIGVGLLLHDISQTRLFNSVKQRTWIYCDCGNEMCSDESFISDTYDENGDNHVRYKCQKCGKESDWNFDIAPVPINWETLK